MATINVGIVGYGWAAGAHIAAINAGGLARVTRVCSTRPLDAAALSARHGCRIETHTDYAEFLGAPGLDAVSICSLHSLHRDQVIAAARAGKHVLCEKPLALNPADLRVVEREVRAAGVVFAICFEARYSAQFRAIRSILDRGLLGRVHYAEIDYYHGIGPWYPAFRWYPKAEECVSSLMLAGCHAMDAMLLCMGDDIADVTSLATRSANPLFAPYEFPTTTVTLLRFRDGRLGKVASVIDCLQPYYFHTHLVGSEGALLDDRFHSNLVAGLDRSRWSRLSYRPIDSGDVSDHPYKEEFDRFFETIAAGGEMPLTGLDQAVRTHEVIFAADRSWREGRPVTLEEIRGD